MSGKVLEGAGSRRHSRLITATPVFYGWVILAVGAIGNMMTLPGQTAGVSVFLESILQDLNLSRSAASLLYTVGTLIGGVSTVMVGRAIDRYGSRRLVTVIAALFALACFGMAFVRDAFTLLLGFTAIRGLGQGALGLVSLQAISLWFVRRRGLAVGIAGITMALASAVFPALMQPVLSSWGWRGAYALLGGVIALTILPLGALFFRNRPEEYGLVPDGLPAGSDETSERDGPSQTLAEARRTPLFWLLLSGGFLAGGLGTGLVFHHFSIMANNGLGRAVAAGVFVPMAITTAGMNLLTGILLDRVRPLALMPVSMGLLCLSLVGATLVHHPLAALGYGLILGGMQGMQGAIGSVAWAHYFGRDHLGAIRGFAFAVSIVGAAVGPLPVAWSLQWFNSYRPMLLGLALLPLAASLASLVMDYQHRHRR